MTDTEIILKEIGDFKTTVATNFGDLKSEIATLSANYSNSNTRINALEEDKKNAALWHRINSLAIILVPPGIHKVLSHIGWL